MPPQPVSFEAAGAEVSEADAGGGVTLAARLGLCNLLRQSLVLWHLDMPERIQVTSDGMGSRHPPDDLVEDLPTVEPDAQHEVVTAAPLLPLEAATCANALRGCRC